MVNAACQGKSRRNESSKNSKLFRNDANIGHFEFSYRIEKSFGSEVKAFKKRTKMTVSDLSSKCDVYVCFKAFPSYFREREKRIPSQQKLPCP